MQRSHPCNVVCHADPRKIPRMLSNDLVRSVAQLVLEDKEGISFLAQQARFSKECMHSHVNQLSIR